MDVYKSLRNHYLLGLEPKLADPSIVDMLSLIQLTGESNRHTPRQSQYFLKHLVLAGTSAPFRDTRVDRTASPQSDCGKTTHSGSHHKWRIAGFAVR